jgi:2-polyprenyl-3-methyl-5-hydroxy-6-metoxy-1,4-benzoquinol methylase
MIDLSVRADLPELMDADDLDVTEYDRCLGDLAAVNRVTFTHRATLQFLMLATRTLSAGETLHVLDLGCGHGDLLRAIARWAAKKGFKTQLTGIDLNPRSATSARAATPPGYGIEYLTGDVFQYVPETPPDFIVTSQFTHHLPDADIIRLLKWMDRTANRGWNIADLHRHIVPYYGFRVLCRMIGWHPIVRYDGTISIARSFKRADWERYLAEAGVQARISWHPLFRYAVGRIKP